MFILPTNMENIIQSLDFQTLNNMKNKKQEWLKSKKGYLSSSQISRLMTYENKNELPKGAITYIFEKVLERLTDGKSKKEFYNQSMSRGNNYELVALEEFLNIHDCKVELTGDNQKFFKHNDYFGGTPDGVIYSEKAIIEIKCPDSSTHYRRKYGFGDVDELSTTNFKDLETEIYWQIQGNLLCTKMDKCYFIDFDDRFLEKKHHLLIVEVYRNNVDIEKIKSRLELAVNEYKRLLK